MSAPRISQSSIAAFVLIGLLTALGNAETPVTQPATTTAPASRPTLRVANPPLLSQNDIVPFNIPTPSLLIRYKIVSIERHGLQSHSLSVNNETACLVTRDPAEEAPEVRIEFMRAWGGFASVHRGRDLIIVLDKQMSRVLFVAEAPPAK